MGVFAELRHRRVTPRLDAYVDRELDAASVPAVERHLGECEGCRETVAVTARLTSSLRRLRGDGGGTVARLRRWVAAELTRPGPGHG